MSIPTFAPQILDFSRKSASREPRAASLSKSCQTQEVQGRTFWFEDTQHAAVDIKRIMSPCDAILLKGSRTMGLERLVEPLKEEAVATV